MRSWSKAGRSWAVVSGSPSCSLRPNQQQVCFAFGDCTVATPFAEQYVHDVNPIATKMRLIACSATRTFNPYRCAGMSFSLGKGAAKIGAPLFSRQKCSVWASERSWKVWKCLAHDYCHDFGRNDLQKSENGSAFCQTMSDQTAWVQNGSNMSWRTEVTQRFLRISVHLGISGRYWTDRSKTCLSGGAKHMSDWNSTCVGMASLQKIALPWSYLRLAPPELSASIF